MTRKALSPPHLDQAALEKQIEAQAALAEGAQIYSRSQVLLETAEARAKELEKEGKHERGEIARLKNNLAELNKILERMEANESDIAVELSAILQQINTLRQAGVTL